MSYEIFNLLVCVSFPYFHKKLFDRLRGFSKLKVLIFFEKSKLSKNNNINYAENDMYSRNVKEARNNINGYMSINCIKCRQRDAKRW